MILEFTLTMPNVGSWNRVDTGARSCCIYKKVKKVDGEKIVDQSFYYNFGDGWGANVSCKLVPKKLKDSNFRGYDWMVKSILEHGVIKT